MNPWQTEIPIKKPPFPITLGKSFYVIGSCFSDHIKTALSNNLFSVTASPFGTEYNFLSMAHGLSRILSEEQYDSKDVIQTTKGFTTWSHHSQISFENQTDLLKEVNHHLAESLTNLSKTDYLIITPGTAYCYFSKESSMVVNNCHKMPANLFSRRPCTVEEMVKAIAPSLEKLKSLNQRIKFIFTLSPVKHLRDDPTENSYSKSLCRCSIEELINIFRENSYYFPAYEIMTDELRDYRFYDKSMTHPSLEAVEFIINKFFDIFLDLKGQEFFKEWKPVLKFLQHRRSQPDFEIFLNENLTQKNKILTLQGKFPQLNWNKLVHII